MPGPLSPAPITPKDNRLLAALPQRDYSELQPFLEPVGMPLGEAMYESGGRQDHVWFPTSSIVSLLYVLADGLIEYSRGHIRVIDREGLESRVCECYAVVKKEYDRLLPD